MATWVEGIDISVYQGELDQATWRLMERNGQRLAVIGSAHQRPNIYTQGNLLRALGAGMKVATYMALYPGVSPRGTIMEGRRQCGEAWEQIRFVSVDVEVPGITHAEVEEAVQAVIRMGKRPCIYTAYWYWTEYFGNSTAFKHVPLWNAYYDSDADIDFGSAPYGGWTVRDVIGEQYAGSVLYQGVTVDRNTFDMDWVLAAEPSGEEDEVTQEQYEALMRKLAEMDTAMRYIGLALKNQANDQTKAIAAIAKNLDEDHQRIEAALEGG